MKQHSSRGKTLNSGERLRAYLNYNSSHLELFTSKTSHFLICFIEGSHSFVGSLSVIVLQVLELKCASLLYKVFFLSDMPVHFLLDLTTLHFPSYSWDTQEQAHGKHERRVVRHRTCSTCKRLAQEASFVSYGFEIWGRISQWLRVQEQCNSTHLTQNVTEGLFAIKNNWKH